MRTLGFLVAATTLVAGTASAEIYGYQVLGKKVEVTRPDQADRLTSVYEYPRMEYRPEGRRLGQFEVYATATADLTYNDNLYATENAQESDFITRIKPAVVVTSDWARHQLVGRAHAEMAKYADNGDEDYTNYGTNVSGRVDVLRNSYATGSAGVDIKHEDRGAPNAVSAAVKPTEYQETQFQLGYVHAPARLSFSTLADVKMLDYKDDENASGAVIDQDGRDRTERALTLQLGYEIQPSYEAFVRTTFSDIEYDQSASQDRNSNGTSVVAGLAMDLTGKVRGEIYAGVMERSYDGAAYKDVSTASYGGNMLWNVNGLTSVIVDAERNIGETTIANSSGYVNTGLGVSAQHELRRNVLLGANIAYANHDYTGNGITREDDYINAGAEMRYLLNKNISAGLQYGFTARDSSIAGADYDRNVIKATLSGAL